MLGVSPRVVRNAIARHELDAVKRGARWLIPADAVQRWTHDQPSEGSRRRPRSSEGRRPLSEALGRLDAI